MKFNLGKIFRKDRRLGIAAERGHYDLPLSQDEGTSFLRLLVALMSFLAAMALTGSFALDSLTERWSSGLENKLTIEIPAERLDGSLRQADEIQSLARQVEAVLKNERAVKTIHILNEQDIQNLIEPWLGKNAPLGDLPLPGLISVELNHSTPDVMDKIKKDVNLIDKEIVVDTHEDWLQSLLRMISSLRFAALIVVAIIAGTTVIAIAGAIRSRIAVHKADVELLHLMGAGDEYIVRQFQRHAVIIALQGSLVGTLSTLLVLAGIKFSGGGYTAFLPAFDMHISHGIALAALPVMACLIAAVTARLTVLRSLSLMP